MFQLSVLGIAVSVVIFLFRSYELFDSNSQVTSVQQWKELIDKPGFFYQAMFLTGMVQAAFLIPGWLMLKAGKINSFLMLQALNMLVVAQPLIFYGWMASGSPEELNRRIKNVPRGFPAGEINLPVSEYRSHELYDYGMFRNVGSFYARRPLLNSSFTSPTKLTAYLQFLSDTALVESLSGYPAVNFGDSIVSGKTLVVHSRSNTSTDISVSVFSPDEIRCNLTNTESGMFWVFQNNYPGWTAKVDGRPETIQTVNHCFMGVPLRPGAHEVIFSFRPRWLLPATVFSITGLLLCSWLLFRPLKRSDD
jgi:hypothetical protein